MHTYTLRGIWLLLFCLAAPALRAQSADIPLHDESYQLIDRLDIKGVTGVAIPTDIKPYPRDRVAALLAGLDSNIAAHPGTFSLGLKDRAWIARSRFLLDDAYPTEGKGYYGFYTNKRDLLSVRQKDFELYLNPNLDFAIGHDQNTLPATLTTPYRPSEYINRNQRGVSVRGKLFGKLGFYADINIIDAVYPAYLKRSIDSTGFIPGAGYYKPFGNGGYDYFMAKGYLTYSPNKYLRFKFGNDRSLWGQGSQSLLLSDNATDYLSLSFELNIWKLQYVTQYSQLIDFQKKFSGDQNYPRKYAVFHQLSIHPIKELSIGVFESIVYDNGPTGQRGIELQYLNPLIFYRSAEQNIGSPDNTQIGFTAKANLFKRLQIYGQLFVDDFNLGAGGLSYWGDKLAYQLGLKYIDLFGIETLDLQAEYNLVRPYVYSHDSSSSNYTHYGQYLGYSLGGNAYDFNFTLQYQPIPKLYCSLRFAYLKKGLDQNGKNYGGDVTKNYNVDRYTDFGVVVGQGKPYTLQTLEPHVSYQFWNLPLYADADLLLRKDDSYTTTAFTIGLRYAVPYKPVMY